jgi:RNA polymerase sigma-70 factor, ECF subfamily
MGHGSTGGGMIGGADGVDAIRAGDEAAFGRAVGRHQRELQVHCYRMLGSFEEARDLTQETFLRAWTGRSTFRGDASLRAWLYRIATNACLDFLAKHPREPLGSDGPAVRVPWLQPYPDDGIPDLVAADPTPDSVAVANETVELAFLAALQHLGPKERAVLILRDVLGWSAPEAAEVLGASVGAVTSRLQRARVTMRAHLPERRADWSAATEPGAQLAVVRQLMDALERADDDAIAALLHEDVLVAHQGHAGGNLDATPVWYSGRATVIEGWAPILHGPHAQDLRFVLTRANNAPAYGVYARGAGSDGPFEPFAFSVLRIEDGQIVELTTFGVEMVAAFGLPAVVAA